MENEISIHGKMTILEPVKFSDSNLICSLRNNPNINKYLSSQIQLKPKDQEKWILENNKIKNYYFKIVEKTKQLAKGTISLYNFNDFEKKAEFGRYICINPIMAIESELMLIRFGFMKLGLNQIYCKTDFRNKSVWKQHYQFGFEDFGMEKTANNKTRLKVQILDKKKFIGFNYYKLDSIIKKFSNFK